MQAKPAKAPTAKANRVSTTRAGATPAQIENAGQAYARLTEADGQLDNFNSRGPVAAQELNGLLKAKTYPKNAQTLQVFQLTLANLMAKV